MFRFKSGLWTKSAGDSRCRISGPRCRIILSYPLSLSKYSRELLHPRGTPVPSFAEVQKECLLLLLLVLESLRLLAHLPIFVNALGVDSVYPPLWLQVRSILRIRTQTTHLVQKHEKHHVVPAITSVNWSVQSKRRNPNFTGNKPGDARTAS